MVDPPRERNNRVWLNAAFCSWDDDQAIIGSEETPNARSE